ncbi:hypothetical protein ACHAXT_001741 [Thalassiosira profunda]
MMQAEPQTAPSGGPSTEEPTSQPQEAQAVAPWPHPYPPPHEMAPPPTADGSAPPPGYPPYPMYPYPPYGAPYPPPPGAPGAPAQQPRNGAPAPPPGAYPPPPPGAWGYPPYPMPPYDPNNPQGAPPPPPYPYDPYYPYPPPPPGAPTTEVQHAPPPPQPVAILTHPIPPSETKIVHQASPSAAVPKKTKSVRRKKKMYSDFVGVTYNKTHAKYQSCITHYRKQHYLGRYKLAVDAALAYDESARLLKGSSWKVNFPTRDAYEAAKAKELETLGHRRDKVDVAQSLAAVAMKVEEIAANVNKAPGMGWKGGTGRHGMVHLPPAGHRVEFVLPEGHGAPGAHRPSLLHGPGAAVFHGNSQGKTPAAVVIKGAAATPGLSKVTPSPTFLFGEPPPPEASPPDSVKKQLHPPETPIPETPHVTKHVMGTASKNTPDSVMRPKVLSYRKGGTAEGATAKSEGASPRKEGSPAAKSPKKQSPAYKSPAAKSPRAKPMVMQNGTLAAASALMDLGSPSPEKDDE